MLDHIYIEYSFTVSPKEPATEILIAELGNVGFESFVENENGVSGLHSKRELERPSFGRYFCFELKGV